jgi:hypothetical protein
VRQWDEAQSWTGLKSDFTSLAAKISTLTSIAEGVSHFNFLAAEMSDDQVDALYNDWLSTFRTETYKRNSVAKIALVIPFGLTKMKPRFNGDKPEVTMPCLVIKNLHAFVFKRATEATKALVRNAYVSIHGNKTAGANNFDREVRDDEEWSIQEYPKLRAVKEGYFLIDTRHEYLSNFVAKGPDPLLNPIIETMVVSKDRITWLADGITNEDGSCTVDATIGLKRPEGYGPFEIWSARASKNNDKGTTLIWYDIFVDPEVEREDPNNSATWKALEMGTWSRSSRQVATMEEAHRFVEVSAKEEGRTLVPSDERPDLPQPTDGIKRWYAI